MLLTGCTSLNSSNNLNNNVVKPIYTISFFEDGGNEVSDIKEEAGVEITLPVTLKNGMNFEGWYYDYGTYNQKCQFR